MWGCRARADVAVGFGAVAAGDGDVELGVAPHAVFVDVEAAGFDVVFDADAEEFVHDVERAEAGGEAEGADGGRPRVGFRVGGSAGVDEAAFAGGEFVCQGGDGEEAGREGAPDAGHAVHGDGADRVVDADLLDVDDAEDGDEAGAAADQDRRPGGDEAEAAVIATRAPNVPLSIIEMSGLPSLTQATHMPVTAPAAAAMLVVRAT